MHFEKLWIGGLPWRNLEESLDLRGEGDFGADQAAEVPAPYHLLGMHTWITAGWPARFAGRGGSFTQRIDATTAHLGTIAPRGAANDNLRSFLLGPVPMRYDHHGSPWRRHASVLLQNGMAGGRFII